MATKFQIEVRAPSIAGMPSPEMADLLLALQRMTNAVPLKMFLFKESAAPGVFDYEIETVDGRHFVQIFNFLLSLTNPGQSFTLSSSVVWSLAELAPQRVVRDACITAKNSLPGLTMIRVDWKD